MDNKLLFGVLIVIIFIFIILVPLLCRKKEGFVTYKYPNSLMMSHNDFVNAQSNKYSNIYNLFDKIANQVYSNYNEQKIESGLELSFEVIIKLLFIISYQNYDTISNKPTCTATNKNEECKLYVIILQYLMKKHTEKSVEGLESIDLTREDYNNNDVLKLDLVNSDTDIENNIKFNKVSSSLINLRTKMLPQNINNFTEMRQEIIVKKFIKGMLFEIFFTIYPTSIGGLACPLYTADSCPSVPYQAENDSQTLPVQLLDKYKCKIDKSFNSSFSEMSNLCVSNDNNKHITSNCEIMNGYGKTMCENTLHKIEGEEPEACKFENLTQRCVNSNTNDENYLNTDVNSDGEYLVNSDFDDSKCHLIYHSNLDEMEKLCNSQNTDESQKCVFTRASEDPEDENSKQYGLCIAKDKTKRPTNFCLGLSNIHIINDNANFATENEIECTNINRGSNFYSVTPPDCEEGDSDCISEKLAEKLSNMQCNLFDTSAEKVKEGEDAKSPKEEEEMAFINGNNNQKNLCESLSTDLGERKCSYIEYQKYIPEDHNSKYAQIGMCIPKGSINLEAELIKNEDECHSNFHWSDRNKLCINPESKCHSFKHKKICNYYDNCLWQASDVNASDEEYEFGYCRDLSSSLKRVDDLIDNIHQSHLQNAVELNTIEDRVSKLIPNFKNVLTSV